MLLQTKKNKENQQAKTILSVFQIPIVPDYKTGVLLHHYKVQQILKIEQLNLVDQGILYKHNYLMISVYGTCILVHTYVLLGKSL